METRMDSRGLVFFISPNALRNSGFGLPESISWGDVSEVEVALCSESVQYSLYNSQGKLVFEITEYFDDDTFEYRAVSVFIKTLRNQLELEGI